MTEDGDEAALRDRQVQTIEDDVRLLVFLRLIGVMQVFDFDRCGHSFSFVQRQVAPHGRARPVSRTGRPSSSDWV